MQRYKAGATIQELAVQEGLSYGTVWRRLREAGVWGRPAKGARSPEAEAQFDVVRRLADGLDITNSEWDKLRAFLGAHNQAHAVSLAYQAGMLVVVGSPLPPPAGMAERDCAVDDGVTAGPV